MKVNKIYCQSSDNMYQVKDESIDLIITSPPYNVGIQYDTYADQLEWDVYLNQFLLPIWKECYRVLKPAGRICVNIAAINRKPYLPLHHWISCQLTELGMKHRGEIIWYKGGCVKHSTAWGSYGSASNPYLRDSHEYIEVFSKSEYALEDKSKNVPRKKFELYTRGEWNIRTENNTKKHPVPFPEELPRRLIHLYSQPGAIVLDPFCGSGTTCYIAKLLQRKYIGFDISLKYVKISQARCMQQSIVIFQ